MMQRANNMWCAGGGVVEINVGVAEMGLSAKTTVKKNYHAGEGSNRLNYY
jgi:hypothetical protein